MPIAAVTVTSTVLSSSAAAALRTAVTKSSASGWKLRQLEILTDGAAALRHQREIAFLISCPEGIIGARHHRHVSWMSSLHHILVLGAIEDIECGEAALCWRWRSSRARLP